MSRYWFVAGAFGALTGTGAHCAAVAGGSGLFELNVFGAAQPAGAVVYRARVVAEGATGKLSQLLRDASLLIEGQAKGVRNAAALVALARADTTQLIAALYARGYYGGKVSVSIGGKPLEAFDTTEIGNGQMPLDVVVVVATGPRFEFGTLSLTFARSSKNFPALSPSKYDLIAGQPARSTIVVAALDRIVRDLKRRGFALARIADKRIVADHQTRRLNVSVVVDPGRRATIGTVTVTGANRLNAAKINAHSALRPGQPYDPSTLQSARERLRKFDAIDGVRILEGTTIDDEGRLPITINVRERKDRFIGASAAMSSVDGGEAQAYWGHRNLLGSGEVLRIVGTVSRVGTTAIDDLDYKLAASLLRPGIFDIDTDLVSEVSVGRERPDTYKSRTAKAKLVLNRRFSRELAGSIGVEGSLSHVADEAQEDHYALIGLPAEISYDGRDKRLDATRGWRASISMTPYADLLNNDAFAVTRLQVSHYLALQPDGTLVLAARAGFGSAFGAGLFDIPATHRFFAGGGGSIRGFGYRTVGLDNAGKTIGGRSITDGSLELRYRLSKTLGFVPFIDVGTVSEDSFPTFSAPFRVGAGVGLRYYTVLGPLRLDLAFPVNPLAGDPRYAVYVGLGQSF